MKRAWLCLIAAACGDNAGPDILAQLQALPGVTASEVVTQTPDARYFVLEVTQPVDHAQPDGPTFQEEVSLLHVDVAAPMVVETDGYWDYTLDTPVEVTRLLAGNQISIEHRFFGSSRPEPADWSTLTIEQMADDEHAIISALRTIYAGPFVATGGSKGGMAAVYHRRFFPDDVAGTVPYVAPLSFGVPDARYAAFLDTLGPADCRQAVRDAATEMLANRRATLEAAATAAGDAAGEAFTRVAIGPAVESAIQELEWSFWQYHGVDACTDVPTVTASDDDMFAFLETISPIEASDDAEVAQFEAWTYQSYGQLGYPDIGGAYLTPYVKYTAADYAGTFPAGAMPVYDGGTAMHDIDDYVEHQGAGLVFVYGQWDPWSGGMFALGDATDSLRLVKAAGTHESEITQLADGDRDAALGELAAWTGVTPDPTARATHLAEPRVPPAIQRALQLRYLR